MARTDKPTETALYVVLESFTTDIDGVPVTYRQGEPIHPADIAIKRNPKAFGPLVFPHPVKGLGAPEVRAD